MALFFNLLLFNLAFNNFFISQLLTRDSNIAEELLVNIQNDFSKLGILLSYENAVLFLSALISFSVSLMVYMNLHVANSKLNSLSKTIQFLFSLLFIYGGVFFAIVYMLRLYNLSRVIILVALLMHPLITYLLIILQKIDFTKSKNIIIKSTSSVLFVLLVFAFIFSVNQIINSEQLESLIGDTESNLNNLDKESAYLNMLTKYKEYKSEELINFELHKNWNYKKIGYCCNEFSRDRFGYPPVGKISLFKSEIFFLNSWGELFTIDRGQLFNNSSVSMNHLESNLKELTNVDPSEFKQNAVYDLLVYKEKIFVSYTNLNWEEQCWELVVFESDINTLFFKPFFKTQECISSKEYVNPIQSGGEMYPNNDEILLSIGDYGVFNKPQDDTSLLGKILSINMDTKEFKVISKGHRNPQGMYLDNTGVLITTDHGPLGGDEINFNKLNEKVLKNYGWPISSYGNHYSEAAKQENLDIAPMHKSHSDYGFIEPAYYFPYEIYTSHGVHSLEKNHFEDNAFFVSSLNGQTLYNFEFDFQNNTADIINQFRLGERIRDIKYDEISSSYLLILEGTPAIAILTHED
jgi:hypothetical protein